MGRFVYSINTSPGYTHYPIWSQQTHTFDDDDNDIYDDDDDDDDDASEEAAGVVANHYQIEKQ